jgi:predicted nucleic acid-binding Zn ribbon protein
MPVRKRNLARQRQRDMLLFFIAVGVLLLVMGILIWVAYVRNTAPGTGP